MARKPSANRARSSIRMNALPPDRLQLRFALPVRLERESALHRSLFGRRSSRRQRNESIANESGREQFRGADSSHRCRAWRGDDPGVRQSHPDSFRRYGAFPLLGADIRQPDRDADVPAAQRIRSGVCSFVRPRGCTHPAHRSRAVRAAGRALRTESRGSARGGSVALDLRARHGDRCDRTVPDHRTASTALCDRLSGRSGYRLRRAVLADCNDACAGIIVGWVRGRRILRRTQRRERPDRRGDRSVPGRIHAGHGAEQIHTRRPAKPTNASSHAQARAVRNGGSDCRRTRHGRLDRAQSRRHDTFRSANRRTAATRAGSQIETSACPRLSRALWRHRIADRCHFPQRTATFDRGTHRPMDLDARSGIAHVLHRAGLDFAARARRHRYRTENLDGVLVRLSVTECGSCIGLRRAGTPHARTDS